MVQAQPPTQDALGPTQREPFLLLPPSPSRYEVAPQGRIAHIRMSPTASVSHDASIRGPAYARAAPLPPSPLRRAMPPGCRGARWNGLALAASDGGGCRDDRSSDSSAHEAMRIPATQTPATYRRGAPYNIISNLP
ncbi:alpha-tubulin_N-acetyltransferase_-_putative [Leishmania major strain Friedlin]|nr:alpha-tubulin_N-acetyltransferase_-_putative [Leishmania major strain Friedlin]